MTTNRLTDYPTIIPRVSRWARWWGSVVAYLLVFAAVTCWAMTGIIFAVVLGQVVISPLTVVFLRNLTAFLLLGVFIVVWRRKWLRLAWRDLPLLAVNGLIYVTLFNPALIYSYQTNGVAVATALLYLFPVHVTLVSAWWLGETINWRKGLALALCLAGAFVVVAPWRSGEARASLTGVAFGVVAALMYGTYGVLTKALLGRLLSPTVLFYSLGIGCLTYLPVQLLAGSDLPDLWATVQIGLATGVLVTLLPLLLFTAALSRLPAGNASIAATIEPALSIVFAALLLGQYLAPVQLSGAALIIGGVLVLSRA